MGKGFARCRRRGYVPRRMSAAVSPDAAALPAPGPAVKPAGAVLRQIGQAMGLEAAPAEQLADLPEWSQEEASAFERTIEEV